MADQVYLASPLEPMIEGNFLPGGRFREFPDTDEERIPFMGASLSGRFRPVSIQSDRFLIVSPYAKVGGGILVPKMIDAETETYTQENGLKLGHFDFGVGMLITGLRIGKNSYFAPYGTVQASVYEAAGPDPSAEVDRYGNYSEVRDQGGIPLPLQHENAQVAGGLHFTGHLGAEIRVGLTQNKNGPGFHIAWGYEVRKIATSNKGKLHRDSFELSLGFSCDF